MYDRGEIIDALRDEPAWMVKERFGLPHDVRTLQRWARREYGSIPTRKAMLADRDRYKLVLAAEADGLDRRYCIQAHHSFWPCLLRRDDVGLVFVCRKHASRGCF